MEIFNETQQITEFCFAKRDIPRLSDALQLPHKIVCCERIFISNIEALCIFLK